MLSLDRHVDNQADIQSNGRASQHADEKSRLHVIPFYLALSVKFDYDF